MLKPGPRLQEMSLLSSTASLRSSIFRTMDENGRKYHGYKEGKYLLPIDNVSPRGPAGPHPFPQGTSDTDPNNTTDSKN